MIHTHYYLSIRVFHCSIILIIIQNLHSRTICSSLANSVQISTAIPSSHLILNTKLLLVEIPTNISTNNYQNVVPFQDPLSRVVDLYILDACLASFPGSPQLYCTKVEPSLHHIQLLSLSSSYKSVCT